MKFVKHPLLESHKPLPTVYFDTHGKASIVFQKETFIDGETGEIRMALVYETNKKDEIELIEAMEKELSEKLTIKKRKQFQKRMNKFKNADNKTDITDEQIKRINIVCKYNRGSVEKPQEKRQLEKPVKAVQ